MTARRKALLVLAMSLLAAACSGSDEPPPPPPQPEPGNTGAFALLQVGSTLKLYAPAARTAPNGNARLAVLDASRPNGAAALLRYVDLGPAGRADTVAAAPGIVLALGGTDPIVWFVDPATDAVVHTLTLDGSFGTMSVSGRVVFMSGAAIDEPARRAYLGVWNGFAVLDLDSRQIVDTLPAAPAENFALDVTNRRIVAPYYGCLDAAGAGTPPPCGEYLDPSGVEVTDGVTLVDLATAARYAYVDPLAADPAAPLGIHPDASAVDPAGQLAFVPIEEGQGIARIDVGAAALDPVTGTFTAPVSWLLATPPPSSVGVEPGARLGFAAQENGTYFGVFDASAPAGDVPLTVGTMPELPWAAGSFVTKGDPHGVRTGVFSGRPFAFVLNDERTWVARVDLEALMALGARFPGGIPPEEAAAAIAYVFAGDPP